MKRIFVLINIGLLLTFSLCQTFTFSQLFIISDVSPDDIVENIVGDGIEYSNVEYTGDSLARGIFYNGGTTNLGVDNGIFLTSGRGFNLPGPNNHSSISWNNGEPGDELLDSLIAASTFDAAILEFDIIPESDTLRFKFVFGSDEYHEWVNSQFVDVFGFFVSGPDPEGGFYINENIAIVPDTNLPVNINTINNGYAPSDQFSNGPCTNCEYFVDNFQGLTIQYDGFTTVLPAFIVLVSGEEYHIKMAIADAGDPIYDSGIFIEENSFYSGSSADFFSFTLETNNNPELPYDLNGELSFDTILINVPFVTDLSNLVATFSLSPGATTYVDDIEQVSGITPNDFTDTLTYTVVGENNYTKHWLVIVDLVTSLNYNIVENISVYPNPASDKIIITEAKGVDIAIVNILGLKLLRKEIPNNHYYLNVSNFENGVYFMRFSSGQGEFVKKIVIDR